MRGHLFALSLIGAGLAHAVAAPQPDAAADYAGRPYGGMACEIPGVIQAEDYDVAPGNTNGVTFNYSHGAKKGEYRTTGDSIGVLRFGDSHVTTNGAPEKPDQFYLGFTHNGEWIKYTVHVAETGTYRFGGKFAAAFRNGRLAVAFSPTLKLGPLAIPTTAGYQPGVEVYHVWEVLDNLGEVTLPAGTYVMTVTLENCGGMNLDYFTLAKIR
jgi:hypothetical protein